MKVEMSFEMPEWFRNLMGDIDSSIVIYLRKEDEEYISLNKELNALLEKYTAVAELLNGEKGVNLTAEEQEALGNKLFNKNEIQECLSKKEVTQDEGQLVGEILWYKKVLYTNGIEWRYEEIAVRENCKHPAVVKSVKAALDKLKNILKE